MLVVTGLFLSLVYVPDVRGQVTYQGPYVPLRGQPVTEAFNSVLRISLEVPAGLLVRQTHHWASLVFVAAIVLHLCRSFFTGAFRRPRQRTWVVGIAVLLLAMAQGLAGYSLPNDLLSGMSLQVVWSAVLAIPVIVPEVAYLLFGGEVPSPETIPRLFALHTMLLPRPCWSAWSPSTSGPSYRAGASGTPGRRGPWRRPTCCCWSPPCSPCSAGGR